MMLESQKRVTMRTMGEFWHLAGDFMGEFSAGPGRASAGIFESFHHARIGEFSALPQITAVDFLTHSETHPAGKIRSRTAAGPWQNRQSNDRLIVHNVSAEPRFTLLKSYDMIGE